ncbi:hypothetical protein LguiA_023276 [Lonicera macranthoides]
MLFIDSSNIENPYERKPNFCFESRGENSQHTVLQNSFSIWLLDFFSPSSVWMQK